jgi:hypothetical protein
MLCHILCVFYTFRVRTHQIEISSNFINFVKPKLIINNHVVSVERSP